MSLCCILFQHKKIHDLPFFNNRSIINDSEFENAYDDFGHINQENYIFIHNDNETVWWCQQVRGRLSKEGVALV